MRLTCVTHNSQETARLEIFYNRSTCIFQTQELTRFETEDMQPEEVSANESLAGLVLKVIDTNIDRLD
jgi:hypothetical protein